MVLRPVYLRCAGFARFFDLWDFSIALVVTFVWGICFRGIIVVVERTDSREI